MKYLLTILTVSMMAQVAWSGVPTRYSRHPTLFADTEKALKSGWDMVKSAEIMIKDVIKQIPKKNEYETAKENLRTYLTYIFAIELEPKHCLWKVTNSMEEFFYLVDVEEENQGDNDEEEEEESTTAETADEEKKSKEEVDEDEKDDESVEENKESEEHKPKSEEEGNNYDDENDDDDEDENDEDAADNDKEEDKEESDEYKDENDDENYEETKDENPEENEGDNEDEDEEEEEEEEDPASYAARLDVANMLKKRANSETLSDMRQQLELIQNITTYINEEMRSADFELSMKLFELQLKTC